MSDDDENPDDFSAIIAEQQQPDDGEPVRIGMVRHERAKDSAEIEERERVYLESLLTALPIPFFSEGADVCDPPTPPDAKDMMAKFGVTVEEYQELMKPRALGECHD